MTAAPLLAGVVLCILGGVVRVRAWHAALAGTAHEVRYRDVVIAHLGGAGFNGLVPAHGGDAVKLALLKRRRPEVPFGQLLGSLAPPAALEALLTALLLAWALGTGVLAAPSAGEIPLPLVGAAAATAAGALWLLARKAPRLLRDVRAGMAALRRPRELARTVAPWVLAARMFRLAAIACFVSAVGLPVTLAGALVVMAIQGGVGSNGPASAPVRIAVLSASMPAAIGGHSVSFRTAAELIGAAQVGPMVANLAISILVLGITLRTASPRRVAHYCRENVKAIRPAPATVDS
jgi:Lysylphosphatidylglycerol synthase TM region